MKPTMSPASTLSALAVPHPVTAGAEKRRTRLELLVLLLLVMPILFKSGYGVTVLTEVMVFAIAAMSLDLLLGYTGLASFGHATFFGLGAYTVGLLGVHYPALLPVALLAAAAVGAVAAWGGAYLVLRSSGIYFIFLTLALSQMVFAIAFKWKWLTGGDDGLPGVPRPSFGPLDRYINFENNTVFYLFTLAIFLLSYLALKRITNSSFGSVLIGIRENRTRMEALGYNTQAYMVAAFAIAGSFAALAGGLFAHQFRLVSPDQLHWQASAILLVMVVLGGSGSLIGPVIGALLIILLQNVVSTYTERWPSIMAISFIIVVLYARGGVWGFISKSWTRREQK